MFPQPKYAVGQYVYVVSQRTVRKRHACPDCFETQRWTVTTPAGSTFKTPCPRCQSMMFSSEKALSLEYTSVEASVDEIEIVAVRIDTDGHWDGTDYKDPIQYKVRSGHVYPEHRLHDAREAAQEQADATNALIGENIGQRPDVALTHYYGDLNILQAVKTAIRQEHYEAVKAGDRLRDAIASVVIEETEPEERVVSALESYDIIVDALDSYEEGVAWEPHATNKIQRLMTVVRRILDEDDAQTEALRDELRAAHDGLFVELPA